MIDEDGVQPLDDAEDGYLLTGSGYSRTAGTFRRPPNPPTRVLLLHIISDSQNRQTNGTINGSAFNDLDTPSRAVVCPGSTVWFQAWSDLGVWSTSGQGHTQLSSAPLYQPPTTTLAYSSYILYLSLYLSLSLFLARSRSPPLFNLRQMNLHTAITVLWIGTLAARIFPLRFMR